MSKNTNLSFLTDYITADITNGRIGINNASPSYAFDVNGTMRTSGATYLATASGSVGIGTTSPSSPLHIQTSNSGGQNIRIQTSVAAGRNYLQWANGSGDMGYIGYGGADSKFYIINQLNDDMLLYTNSTERMRIKSGGNVLIGTSTDSGYKLNVNGSIYGSPINASTGNFSTVNSSNFVSFVGSTSIAAGATATIYTMDTMGLYTVQASYVGSSIIFCASAIFYAQIYSTNYVKCLDLYDGANIYLFNTGSAIQVRNDGFGTYTFSWTILFQPAF